MTKKEGGYHRPHHIHTISNNTAYLIQVNDVVCPKHCKPHKAIRTNILEGQPLTSKYDGWLPSMGICLCVIGGLYALA